MYVRTNLQLRITYYVKKHTIGNSIVCQVYKKFRRASRGASQIVQFPFTYVFFFAALRAAPFPFFLRNFLGFRADKYVRLR